MFSLNILVSINPALHLSSCSRGDPDYKGNVVSNATFSKIFSPGNRIGWLEAPQRVVNKVLNSGYGISGGSFNHTMLDIAASLISLGLLSENIQETRIFLKESCSAFCDTLEKELPCASFNRPKGGYFVWIALPRTMHADGNYNCAPEQCVHVISQ